MQLYENLSNIELPEMLMVTQMSAVHHSCSTLPIEKSSNITTKTFPNIHFDWPKILLQI